MQWNNKQPIYQQLKDKISAAILDGALVEGQAIPSIRQVCADYQLNPMTVSKAYAALVDDGVVEKRRGLGIFVMPGARKKLQMVLKLSFLQEEWPDLRARIVRLGISLEELLQ